MYIDTTQCYITEGSPTILHLVICQLGEGYVGFNVKFFIQCNWYTVYVSPAGSVSTTVNINFNGLNSGCTFYIQLQGIDGSGYASAWQGWWKVSNESIPGSSYPSEYSPPFFSTVLHQYAYDNDSLSTVGQVSDCVACALATLLDLFQFKRGCQYSRELSISWIFGNRRDTDYQGEDGLMYPEALNNLMQDGCPTADILSPSLYVTYPDNLFYTENFGGFGLQSARNRVITNKQYSNVVTEALYHRIKAWNVVPRGLSYIDVIKDAIYNKGGVLVRLRVPPNFYNVKVSTTGGYVPEPDDFTSYWHGTVLEGWKYMNGNLCWIGQNSWNTGWGDNGHFYLPVDHPMIYEYYNISDMDKPATFSWDTPKIAGEEFKMSAAEWNRLQNCVAARHMYRVGTYRHFNDVAPGQAFTAAIYDDVHHTIQSILDQTYTWTNSGTKISAENHLNSMVRDLNSL
jgi:hypothetical protein